MEIKESIIAQPNRALDIEFDRYKRLMGFNFEYNTREALLLFIRQS